MTNEVGDNPKPEKPFEGLAEDIINMMSYRPPSPDNRVSPFDLTNDELRYHRGETDKVPETLED